MQQGKPFELGRWLPKNIGIVHGMSRDGNLKKVGWV